MKKISTHINNILGYVGLKVIKSDSRLETFSDLKSLAGTQVSHIFDIGANHGETLSELKALWPDAKITGFEPHPKLYRICKNRFLNYKNVQIEQIAFSDQEGHLKFTTSNHSLSFHGHLKYIDENTSEPLKQINIDTATLDKYASKHKIDKISLLKVDTEGHDLAVLKGATKLLDEERIDIIVCEVMFFEHFNGQPLFLEISKYMESKGYKIFDIREIKKNKSGQWRYGNCVYISPSKVREKSTFV